MGNVPGVGTPERYNPADGENRFALDLELCPGAYPGCGLYKSLEELDAMTLEKMLEMTLEQQAEYADAISLRYCMNRKFLQEQLFRWPPLKPSDMKQMNSTSFGNLAVMRLHNPDDPAVKAYYDRFVQLVRATR